MSVKFTKEELLLIQILTKTKVAEIMRDNEMDMFKEDVKLCEKIYEKTVREIGEY